MRATLPHPSLGLILWKSSVVYDLIELEPEVEFEFSSWFICS